VTAAARFGAVQAVNKVFVIGTGRVGTVVSCDADFVASIVVVTLVTGVAGAYISLETTFRTWLTRSTVTRRVTCFIGTVHALDKVHIVTTIGSSSRCSIGSSLG
jgi:hypothetical protein